MFAVVFQLSVLLSGVSLSVFHSLYLPFLRFDVMLG